MDHVLDNPIWNALISGNRLFGEGEAFVKYFSKDIAPFAGLKKLDSTSLRILYDLVTPDREVVLITAKKIKIPAYWQINRQMQLLQMVCNNPLQHGKLKENIISLQKKHVPLMLALTKLTNPGPFAVRTIEFGNYSGILKSNNLIAMAGQRLHVNSFMEISAVCTHPDHIGKGYGTALILDLANKIIKRGEVPFLHVREDNDNAIKLYKSLGFVKRQEMNLNVIQKP